VVASDVVHFFFFFQAEDGIRDRNVTGVQTCALPIWLFCLLMYLIYMYIRRRSTYTRLQSGFVNLDESLEEIGNAPLSQALDALLKKQYRLYEAELQTEKNRQADHLLFMDR